MQNQSLPEADAVDQSLVPGYSSPLYGLLFKVKKQRAIICRNIYKEKNRTRRFQGLLVLISTLKNKPIAFPVKKIPAGLTTWCSIPSF